MPGLRAEHISVLLNGKYSRSILEPEGRVIPIIPAKTHSPCQRICSCFWRPLDLSLFPYSFFTVACYGGGNMIPLIVWMSKKLLSKRPLFSPQEIFGPHTRGAWLATLREGDPPLRAVDLVPSYKIYRGTLERPCFLSPGNIWTTYEGRSAGYTTKGGSPWPSCNCDLSFRRTSGPACRSGLITSCGCCAIGGLPGRRRGSSRAA